MGHDSVYLVTVIKIILLSTVCIRGIFCRSVYFQFSSPTMSGVGLGVEEEGGWTPPLPPHVLVYLLGINKSI